MGLKCNASCDKSEFYKANSYHLWRHPTSVITHEESVWKWYKSYSSLQKQMMMFAIPKANVQVWIDWDAFIFYGHVKHKTQWDNRE